MSASSGILESGSSSSVSRKESSSLATSEAGGESEEVSSIAGEERQDSPFKVVEDGAKVASAEADNPLDWLDSSQQDSPFQTVESSDGLSFGASWPESDLAVESSALTPPAEPPVEEAQSDSLHIRQLELRAIFGMDREMTVDEMLQRSRALPGMRHLARVSSQDMAALEAVRNLLPGLGFGTGALKLYAGTLPLEFIREGPVMLAVQTDGGFAPGVRETLMIVAREIAKVH